MRKTPRQERSRRTVEGIVQAGRVVLSRDGYAAFSTNAVAKEARVSPGSLYQYFPDKAAIIDVILEQYWAQVEERVTASLSDHVTTTGPDTIESVVVALVAAIEQDAELMRVIAEELPLARFKERRTALERRLRDLLTAYLVLASGMGASEASHRSWVLVVTAQAVVTRWVLDDPGLDRDTVMHELTRLSGAYLEVR
ncbi:TetR/AcrR family transcriptional regulator [Nocardioides seonyuensis]|uniref:TetR/AcrR family transcriptional regulator n=1 Tax=Nocardioides seonyuensis TaxID=2518371 RepID=A0A4P7II18_9ACTN|nr:TetR/AcrR family transcriptional regulator [Nocardioides seonyuensis]QBX57049.1 TetR/AcrR family transcriptional regulator [Nocardioides seonyuensis]